MSDEIDGTAADRFIKGMTILEVKNDCHDILILLNSPGGEWYHGMAIYDKIITCPKFVTIHVYGQAMSMASVILQAGDKRLLSPRATLMIHDGEDFSEGHPRKVERHSEEGKRLRYEMYDIYLQRIKEKKKRYRQCDIEKLCDHDTFFTAKRAVEWGLADEILAQQV